MDVYDYLFIGVIILAFIWVFFSINPQSEYKKECKKNMFYKVEQMRKSKRTITYYFDHSQLKEVMKIVNSLDTLFCNVTFVEKENLPEYITTIKQISNDTDVHNN